MDLTSIPDHDVCKFLASRIRSERLRQGYSQVLMAEKSGIPLRTYKRIELMGTGTIQNLIVILRALGRVRAIEVLFPAPVPPRPTIMERANMIADVALKKRQSLRRG